MSQISSSLATDNALRQPVKNGFDALSTDEFVKIIFTELSHQDPFQPNDSAALLQQLSTIRSIESDLNMMERLESLVQENQLAAGSAMIGKFIGGKTVDHDSVAGVVVAVIREGDTVSLELDSGWVVPLSNVETILDPELDQPGVGAGNGTTTTPPVTDDDET
jgi:flagellar basal-body rod modification protein FlgD